jgi:hypothetical protein
MFSLRTNGLNMWGFSERVCLKFDVELNHNGDRVAIDGGTTALIWPNPDQDSRPVKIEIIGTVGPSAEVIFDPIATTHLPRLRKRGGEHNATH